ncbi:MAG: Maf family protein [Rhizomicrobium sp.]
MLILASGSASRARVLAAAGVVFATIPAEVDEAALKDDLLRKGSPLVEVAGALADAKAAHVSRVHADALVLGGDQTLLFGEALVGKCGTLVEARGLLLRLRGKPHRLVGALALARGGEIVWRHTETAQLRMRDFSDAYLDAYLETEGPSLLAAVGCYKIEGLGVQLFDRIEGDYFSILGLPLLPLLAELRRKGVIAT